MGFFFFIICLVVVVVVKLTQVQHEKERGEREEETVLALACWVRGISPLLPLQDVSSLIYLEVPYAQEKDDWGHIWTVYLPNWEKKGFYNQLYQNPCFRGKFHHKQIG